MTKNITLAVDDQVLDRVRVIAAERKTTVNALVREYLVELAGDKERRAEARRNLLNMINKTQARLEPGFVFNREDLYEERLFPRHEHTALRRDGTDK